MQRSMSTPLAGAVLISVLVLFLPVAGNAGLPAPPLPPLLIPVPPPVVLIPGTYAYFAPDVDADLIFYGGYWYRPYKGGWYRASHYNGPWRTIRRKKVPGVLINLPPGYQKVRHGHHLIPYTHLEKNWKTWERNKHWDKPVKNSKSGKAVKSSKSGKSWKRKSSETKDMEPSEDGSGTKDRGK
jgi:hypothetical protein